MSRRANPTYPWSAEWNGKELADALPTLEVLNGKGSETGKKEFFRVTDAACAYPVPGGGANSGQPLWFPPLRDTGDEGRDEDTIAVVTYMIEATDVQLDMKFEQFPFDEHQLKVQIFLPKKHKDGMYELVCEPLMEIPSEGIKPTTEDGEGGKGGRRMVFYKHAVSWWKPAGEGGDDAPAAAKTAPSAGAQQHTAHAVADDDEEEPEVGKTGENEKAGGSLKGVILFLHSAGTSADLVEH